MRWEEVNATTSRQTHPHFWSLGFTLLPIMYTADWHTYAIFSRIALLFRTGGNVLRDNSSGLAWCKASSMISKMAWSQEKKQMSRSMWSKSSDQGKKIKWVGLIIYGMERFAWWLLVLLRIGFKVLLDNKIYTATTTIPISYYYVRTLRFYWYSILDCSSI